MKNNIVAQLVDSLEILNDYPGISDIINLKEARAFLAFLAKINAGSVPAFPELNVESIVISSQSTLQKWIDYIDGVKGVSYIRRGSRKNDECIFSGIMYADLKSLESDDDADAEFVEFEFFACDLATFDGEEGSWNETLARICKHTEKFIIPELETQKEG